MQKEEQPPAICMFLAELEDVVPAGTPMLARRMDLEAREVFGEFSQEVILNKVIKLLLDPC